MLSDDVFRAKRTVTIAELSAWTGFVADVAHVEMGEIGDAWRIALTPHIRTACPVELLLRDDQRYDVRIAGETYEDRPIASLEMFLPVLQAIVDGRVVTRETYSALTGSLRDVETIVRLPDGTVFHQRKQNGADQLAGQPPANGAPIIEVRDRHYVPYHRANGT
jgi:hypothetical protein